MQRIDFILDTPSQAKIAAAFIAGLVEQGITFTATSICGGVRVTLTGGY